MSQTDSQGGPLSAAERQAARRARLAAAGQVKVEIWLSKDEADLLDRLRQEQLGPVLSFNRRALLAGAKFVANSGRPRGSKVRGSE